MDRPRPGPPRAIFFDAGNTLIRMDYGVIAARLSSAGRTVTADAVEDAELRARVKLDDSLAAGASTESAESQGRYLRYVLAPLGVTDEAEVEAIAGWRRAYDPPVGLWTSACVGAAEALRRVRAAGLAAGVISNSNGSVRGILERLGLGAHVDFVIDSSVVGVEKPDPRIFHMAAEAAGVPPADAAYIGDLYSVDVLGARAAGLRAVLIDPRGYWGPRDCPAAPTVADAVALCLP